MLDALLDLMIAAVCLVVSVAGGWAVTAAVLHVASRTPDVGNAWLASDADTGPDADAGPDADTGPGADTGPDAGAGSVERTGPDASSRFPASTGSRTAAASTGPGSGGAATRAWAGPDGSRAREALRGGTWIGLLERFAVTGLLLVDLPSGVALVVAVKGLGRFPELRENPAASERFVIGTFASLIWAAVLGVLGHWLIGLG